jgi:23S rRNA (cytosine1962-C5)-methyltransferase
VSGDPTTPARLRLRVTAAAEASLRSGHPWLFAESIREQNRPGQLSDLAVVYDRRDRFLAAGLYDPHSPIRVRVLFRGKPEKVDPGWWAARLDSALERRARLFDARTTGFRWIHGESDGWPGLVLDRYHETLVLKLYTAAWLPRLQTMADLIISRLSPTRLVLRWSRNIQAFVAEHLQLERASPPDTTSTVLHGPPVDEPVIFLESGLKFEADVLRGQKTGFFLDQRENRREVGRLAAGRKILNAFSFSGAFSLYAAAGGAAAVTDLDISGHALQSSERNFSLNLANPGVAAAAHEIVRADAFPWLAACQGRRFGLIVLDPPSLAKRETERAGAIRAYNRLAHSAMGCLEPGAILVACSCSAHVTSGEFFEAIRSAGTRSGRRFALLQTTGHAPDHPAGFKEAEYLKAIYLRF